MALDFGIGWIFVGIMVLIIFVVVAIVQKRQSMATSAVKIGAVIFVISIGYIFIINKIQMDSFSSVIDGFKIYFSWIYSIFDKAIDITTYAIKQDWTVNSTVR